MIKNSSSINLKLLFSLIFVDLVIKVIVYTQFQYIIEYNAGIIFGFLKDPFWIYILIGIGIMIIFSLLNESNQNQANALTLIFAGAISNIIDRIFLPGVIDYIPIPGITTFNLADIFILFGIIWYLMSSKILTKN